MYDLENVYITRCTELVDDFTDWLINRSRTNPSTSICTWQQVLFRRTILIVWNGILNDRKQYFTLLIFTVFHLNPAVRITNNVSDRVLLRKDRLFAPYYTVFNRLRSFTIIFSLTWVSFSLIIESNFQAIFLLYVLIKVPYCLQEFSFEK